MESCTLSASGRHVLTLKSFQTWIYFCRLQKKVFWEKHLDISQIIFFYVL